MVQNISLLRYGHQYSGIFDHFKWTSLRDNKNPWKLLIFKVQTQRAEQLLTSELILNKTGHSNSSSLNHHEQEVDFKLSQLTKELSLLKDKFDDHSNVNEKHKEGFSNFVLQPVDGARNTGQSDREFTSPNRKPFKSVYLISSQKFQISS